MSDIQIEFVENIIDVGLEIPSFVHIDNSYWPQWPTWPAWPTWPTWPQWPQWIQGIQWNTWPQWPQWIPWNINSLNGLSWATQTFDVGSTGTDFNIVSSGTVHTFNIPDASSSSRWLINSTDFDSFVAKMDNTMTNLWDIIYGGSSWSPTSLVGNITTDTYILSSIGDGTNATAPSWLNLTSTLAWYQQIWAIEIQPDSRYPSASNEYPSATALKGHAWRALDADIAGTVSFGIYDIAVALVDNPWLSTDADWAKIKWSDVNLSNYVLWIANSFLNNNKIMVFSGNTGKQSWRTNVSIISDSISGAINGSFSWTVSANILSGAKMALTIDEAYPLWPTFYYTDYIQNGFTGSSPSTADMSNLFSWIYWKGTGTQTKTAGWYGLSGNQIFLRQQWAGKIDGAQAVAPTVLINSGRLWWKVSAVCSYFSNRGILDDAAYYRWEHNAYIWPEWTFTKLRGIHFKAWSLTWSAVVEGRGIDIDDDVPSVFAWSMQTKKIVTNETRDITGWSGWYTHDQSFNILTATANVTADWVSWSYIQNAWSCDFDLTLTDWFYGQYIETVNNWDPWDINRMFGHASVIWVPNTGTVSDISASYRALVTWSGTISSHAHFTWSDTFFGGTMTNEYGLYFPAWSLIQWGDIRWLFFEDNVKHKLSGQTNLQVGWSWSFAEAWLTIDMQTIPVGNVGTGVDDLMTYTLPAYSLKTGKWVRVKWRWTYANNANVKYMSAVFGGTSLATQWATLSQSGEWCYEIDILYDGWSSQTYFLKFKQTWSQESIFSWSTTADETNSIIIKFTGEWVANNDVVQKWQVIEFL